MMKTAKPVQSRLAQVGPVLLAVVAGSAGGFVADAFQVPLGWMVGAMLACGVLNAAGAPLRLPKQLRWLVLSVIGIYLGASFSPDVLGWLSRSAVTMLAMCLLVFCQTLVAASVMKVALRCDVITALTSCVPGGFSTMLILAHQHGGDEEIVSIVQLVRMIVVLGAVSVIARFGIEGDSSALLLQADTMPRDLWFATMIMLFGLVVGTLTKLPILCLFLPMAIGAFLQTGSVTHMHLPREPLVVALVILGILVGCQWKALRGKKLLGGLVAGVLLGIFLVLTSLGVAFVMAQLLELELLTLILALAPGGVAEISLISVAFNINPSFVVLHHLLRVVFILSCLPFVFEIIAKTRQRQEASN